MNNLVNDKPDPSEIDFDYFKELFLVAFEFYNGKKYDLNANEGQQEIFLKTLLYYFLSRKNFFKSPLLHEISQPNLNKGLLIIGGFGLGKTSVVKTLHQLFRDALSRNIIISTNEKNQKNLAHYGLGFGFNSAHELVHEYKYITENERKYFWKRYSLGTRYFDDLGTENPIMEYGKIEIFKDLMEIRYNNAAKTMASINTYGNTVDETLQHIAERYGERVYDRIFDMFNIIFLTGKSLRK